MEPDETKTDEHPVNVKREIPPKVIPTHLTSLSQGIRIINPEAKKVIDTPPPPPPPPIIPPEPQILTIVTPAPEVIKVIPPASISKKKKKNKAKKRLKSKSKLSTLPKLPSINIIDFFKSKIFITASVCIIVFGSIFLFYTKRQNTNSNSISTDSASLLETIGKLAILPSGEEPVIATVTDLEKLEGQVFFENAQVGDKLLVYSKAKKAIIYRPSENKIIEIGPINSLGE